VKKSINVIILSVLIIFPLIVSIISVPANAQDSTNVGVAIKSNVWVRSGYMMIIYELKFNTTMNGVSFYLPYDIYKSIYNFQVLLNNSTITPHITVEPSINASLKITMDTTVEANTPLVLQFSFVGNSYVYQLTEKPELIMRIPRTLGVDYVITSFNSTIHYESWISNIGIPLTIPSIPSFTFSVSTAEIYSKYSFSNVKPIDLTVEEIIANVTTPIWFRAISLTRTITISASGDIQIEDKYYVQYLGYTKVDSWSPKLQGLTITNFGDDLGTFTYDTNSNKWTLRYALNNSDKAYFIINSKPSNSTLWITTENGITKLKINLFQGLIAPVDNFTAIIIFPPGSTIMNITQPTDYQSSSTLNYIYKSFNVTPLNNMIVYGNVRLASYSDYIKFLNTILLVGIFGGFIVALYLWASLKRPLEEVAKVPVSAVGDLADLYSKRLSLIQELDKLENDYKLKKIKKSIYSQRSHAIRSELITIENNIKISASKIRDTKGKVVDTLKELESLFVTLNTIKASINELEHQLNIGKLSRETYNRLYNNYIRDRQRVMNRIDNLLRQLEELSKT
jgi:hypothetical protein